MNNGQVLRSHLEQSKVSCVGVLRSSITDVQLFQRSLDTHLFELPQACVSIPPSTSFQRLAASSITFSDHSPW